MQLEGGRNDGVVVEVFGGRWRGWLLHDSMKWPPSGMQSSRGHKTLGLINTLDENLTLSSLFHTKDTHHHIHHDKENRNYFMII